MTWFPPQPPGTYPLPEDRPRQTSGTIAALTAGAMGVGVIVGTCFGFAVGMVVYQFMVPGDPSGWDELGAAILGVIIGYGVACVTYMAAAIAAVRRWIRPGQRMWPIVIITAAPTVPTLAILIGAF